MQLYDEAEGEPVKESDRSVYGKTINNYLAHKTVRVKALSLALFRNYWRIV